MHTNWYVAQHSPPKYTRRYPNLICPCPASVACGSLDSTSSADTSSSTSVNCFSVLGSACTSITSMPSAACVRVRPCAMLTAREMSRSGGKPPPPAPAPAPALHSCLAAVR
ncbi:hypothetical protein TSOC_002387 [Tetrabaena socialis]|uniref:Uncharacterized protein n=1 Tax=Tetrabaena socialis TaxID=47790 RepID=A0A2J8AEE0_9CHLO|nr:hypothetical protein TSOC_002387 [Tetrabaena socialis]|eukprot:PNH10891.1 hypothetical protein TSOC_002387 [Tetrabaena socialis]